MTDITPEQFAVLLNRAARNASTTLTGTITGRSGGTVTVLLDTPFRGGTTLQAQAGAGCASPGRVVAYWIASLSGWVAIGQGQQQQASTVVQERRGRAVVAKTGGSLKIAYRLAGIRDTAFIGGFSSDFVTVTADDVDAPSDLEAVYVDNLGDDSHAVDCLFSNDDTLISTRKRLGDNDWSVDTPVGTVAPEYFGRGYWQTKLQYGITIGNDVYPNSKTINIFDGIQQEMIFTAYKQPSFVVVDAVFSNDWTAYLFPDLTFQSSDSSFRSRFLLPSGQVNPDQYSVTAVSSAIVLAANLYTGAGFALYYSGSADSRTDPEGTYTFTLARYSNGNVTMLPTPTGEPRLLSLRDSETLNSGKLSFNNYFLEVDEDGNLRAFKKSDLAALADGDVELDGLIYDGTTLEYSDTETITVVKPDNFTSTSAIQNVSYHS